MNEPTNSRESINWVKTFIIGETTQHLEDGVLVIKRYFLLYKMVPEKLVKMVQQ